MLSAIDNLKEGEGKNFNRNLIETGNKIYKGKPEELGSH